MTISEVDRNDDFPSDFPSDFPGRRPDLNPTNRFDDDDDEMNGFPSSNFGDERSTFPESDRSSPFSERPNTVAFPNSGDFNLEESAELDDDSLGSLTDSINRNRIPNSESSEMQSFFGGEPVDNEPTLEIMEGIQTVREFPVNDDGTMDDDDIDELRDILGDEEERVEELVDEGRLSRAQSNMIEAEIEPLRTGLDVIDENSIDTGDRMIDGGKTFASVVDPMAGAAVTLMDEVGILDPIGSFLGDAWDATIGAIFKK